MYLFIQKWSNNICNQITHEPSHYFTNIWPKINLIEKPYFPLISNWKYAFMHAIGIGYWMFYSKSRQIKTIDRGHILQIAAYKGNVYRPTANRTADALTKPWCLCVVLMHLCSQQTLIPKFVELVFHDCVGLCDGCVDLSHPENIGELSSQQYLLSRFVTWDTHRPPVIST